MIGPNKYGRRNYGMETSPQLNDIRRHLSQLNDLWKQLQVQVDDKQFRLEKALEFQQRYQDALQNVSGWLDLAEQKLFAPDSTMNSEEKVKENEVCGTYIILYWEKSSYFNKLQICRKHTGKNVKKTVNESECYWKLLWNIWRDECNIWRIRIMFILASSLFAKDEQSTMVEC